MQKTLQWSLKFLHMHLMSTVKVWYVKEISAHFSEQEHKIWDYSSVMHEAIVLILLMWGISITTTI